MKIALDYDDTFTRDPVLWGEFVRVAVLRGHDVRFVTFCARAGRDDIAHAAASLGIDAIYCAARQKRHCWDAEVWIDDMPELIPSYDQLRAISNGCAFIGDTNA